MRHVLAISCAKSNCVHKGCDCLKVGAADFYILNCGVYRQNMYVDNDDMGDGYSPYLVYCSNSNSKRKL